MNPLFWLLSYLSFRKFYPPYIWEPDLLIIALADVPAPNDARPSAATADNYKFSHVLLNYFLTINYFKYVFAGQMTLFQMFDEILWNICGTSSVNA